MDNNKSGFYLGARVRSFKYAFKGLKTFFVTQPHAKIHTIAIVVILSAGYYYKLNLREWSLVFFAIGLVIVAEVMNTAIEFLTDIVSPEYNEKAGKVKDLAAAGVLIAAIISVVIACFIFLPKIF